MFHTGPLICAKFVTSFYLFRKKNPLFLLFCLLVSVLICLMRYMFHEGHQQVRDGKNKINKTSGPEVGGTAAATFEEKHCTGQRNHLQHHKGQKL